MKTILFIAGLNERYYYEPFVKSAQDRGLAVYIFDPAAFPGTLNLNINLDEKGNLSGNIGAFTLEENVPKKVTLSLKGIDVAWYLRETPKQEVPNEPSLEIRFRENESRAAFRSLLSILQCKWINSKEVLDRIASNKLYQQYKAQQCGLAVPNTFVGNDSEKASEFSLEHGGALLKSLGYIQLDATGKYFLYSQCFSHQEIKESEMAIQSCPIFAQAYIKKRYEHRVMAIGDRILSCQIDSQASEKTKIDWRHYDFGRVNHCAVELPTHIQEKIRSFMTCIGLRYGALDIIETPDGDFVFLEVNPSGQWGWIYELAGLPIPEAVGEMLAEI